MENFEETSIENEKGQYVGYFLRSKRRKLENDKEGVKFSENTLPPRKRKEKSPILLLPTEILRHILKLIPFQQLSDSVRLVNRRFRVVVEDTLSTTFKMLQRRIKNLQRSTIEALQAAQDDMEIKCCCRLINMLEIVDFQQSVVMSTIWRYAFNHRYETYKSCMYGGLLLDMYEQFLWKFTHKPNELYAAVIARDFALPLEVTVIIQMTKTFCLHFEKTNEETVNDSLMVSGCKLLDLLDTASYAQKDVISETVEDNVLTAKYNYFFANSWFVALTIHSEKHMSWNQKQRMMHMRIRRILLAHTEMFMTHSQYVREKMLRETDDNSVTVRRPSNNVYTGYGDIQDKFFFYGVMNDGAFLQKFHPEDQVNVGDIEDIMEDEPEGFENLSVSEDSDIIEQTPHLGLHIDVKLTCPLSHAPFKFLEEKFPFDTNFQTVEKAENFEKFSLKLKFECPGAKYPRLPTTYLYKFKHT